MLTEKLEKILLELFWRGTRTHTHAGGKKRQNKSKKKSTFPFPCAKTLFFNYSISITYDSLELSGSGIIL